MTATFAPVPSEITIPTRPARRGKVDHKDSMGNAGLIGPGGVQWMTAGRGVVHSEFPGVTTGNLHGFQLWINLPAKHKMCKPR